MGEFLALPLRLPATGAGVFLIEAQEPTDFSVVAGPALEDLTEGTGWQRRRTARSVWRAATRRPSWRAPQRPRSPEISSWW